MEALIARGVRCVVFHHEKISIQDMGARAEAFFGTWIRERCTVDEAVRRLGREGSALHAIGAGASALSAEAAWEI